jgi:hypothetical protein
MDDGDELDLDFYFFDDNCNDVDFSFREIVNDDSDLNNFYGPSVLVIRALFNGEIKREWMPVALAVDTILRNPANGVSIKSAKIDYSGVYSGDWDQSF